MRQTGYGLVFTLALCLMGMFAGTPVFAQEDLAEPELTDEGFNPDDLTPVGEEQFYKARVIEVVEQSETPIGGSQQSLRIELLQGPDEGREVNSLYLAPAEGQGVKVGDSVVVMAVDGVNGTGYWVQDHYRVPSLIFIFAIFIGLTVAFAGWRGFMSLAGLGVSVLVLTLFVVPQIMAGQNPLLVSLVGGLVIATFSIYLAHGFKRRTSVAVLGTLITLVLSIGLALMFVWMAKLFGFGSEEAYYLQTTQTTALNLRGLLLGGIIIGALGVLDDITTAQAAAVDEIRKANPALSVRDLVTRGFSVGREHITSLVNTLVLAYVGASFPLLLLFTAFPRPLWVVLNSEQIAEEIIRTLVGSSALILAVPITTALAAYLLPYWAGKKGEEKGDSNPHAHVH